MRNLIFVFRYFQPLSQPYRLAGEKGERTAKESAETAGCLRDS
ncbi:hypothetical protein CLOLEP_01927 [[Clostridium] leptum DSM 753]|uniref:Uncharacterized protein n=1 Tax=[Clostridium] leptum DSM 753 TaxID=428125 RepID=A7VTN4_9FIRM|nr:hypothetical protein CLOLEP_01927 [[Clostridium] leptum DSM 753]